MKIILCTVPVEGHGQKLNRLRSEGPLGIVPKIAIVSLVKWMERHGYDSSTYDFYDIDMLYPDDNEIESFFSSGDATVVGLSAVISTSYQQIKRIAAIVRKTNPNAWIVMGGNLSASSEAVLYNTEVVLYANVQ